MFLSAERRPPIRYAALIGPLFFAALFVFAPARSQASIIIDSFDMPPLVGQIVSATGAPSSAMNTIPVAGVIGGTRTLYVDNIPSGGGASLSVNQPFPVFDQSKFIFSEDSNVAGHMEVTWDGDLIDRLSGDGFAMVDLTQGGTATGILIAHGSDTPGTMATIRIYHFDGTTNVTNNPFSDVVFPVPVTPPNTVTTLFIPFNNFTGSTNFTNVVAVQLFATGGNAADLAFDFLLVPSSGGGTVVPAPTSWLLWVTVALGAVAWGLACRIRVLAPA